MVLAVGLAGRKNQGENDPVVEVEDSTRLSHQAVRVEDLIELNYQAVEVEDLIEQNYQGFERWIVLIHPQTKRHDWFLLER